MRSYRNLKDFAAGAALVRRSAPPVCWGARRISTTPLPSPAGSWRRANADPNVVPRRPAAAAQNSQGPRGRRAGPAVIGRLRVGVRARSGCRAGRRGLRRGRGTQFASPSRTAACCRRSTEGVALTFGDGSGLQRRIRIDFVEPDPRDPAGEVMLYGLSEQDHDSGEWRNACLPDPDGRRLGFPLAGAFSADGTYRPAPGKLLITCTGGAEGKCVRFGYRPWGHTPDGVSLAPYYQACVRMVRADYCGDGVGHTRNGTPVDIFDRIGIQRDEVAEGMTLEAAWGPEGAVCVSHTRFPSR